MMFLANFMFVLLGGIVMKKTIENLEVNLSKVAYQITKSNVNSACAWFAYQPKLPKGNEKLRK